ncbi:hypothetical protein ACFLS1_06010 [Verrucomicrobiota bacterium]
MNNIRNISKSPLTVLCDVFVFTVLCVFIVLFPPRLTYLSFVFGLRSAVSSDMLGGIATGFSMILLLAYFILMMHTFPFAEKLKLLIVVLFAFFLIILPTVSDMAARKDLGIQSNGNYVSFPHDGGVLQTEAAMDFLCRGVNPYSAYYGDTAMSQSHHSNPALWKSLGFDENPAYRFFPYPPFVLILSLSFRALWSLFFGWYDQRIVYIAALAVLGIVAYALPRKKEFRLPFLAFTVLNPLYAGFFIEGMNDILCVLFLAGTVYALRKEKLRTSAVLLGLSCGLKQFAWIMVPFYLGFVYASGPSGKAKDKFKYMLRETWPLFCTVGIIFIPFLIWDFGGLVFSLIVAQSSLYPVRACSLGVSNFLIPLGLLDSPRASFPCWPFYVFIVLPVCIYGIKKILVQRTISAMLAWYSVTLLLFTFFSRFFSYNYLYLIVLMMVSAVVIKLDAVSRES